MIRSYVSGNERVVFRPKSRDGALADIRARLGALGRPDVIAELNSALARRDFGKFTAFRIFEILLRQGPDRAAKYIAAIGTDPIDRISRGHIDRIRGERGGVGSFRRRSAERALALDDPCAGIGDDA